METCDEQGWPLAEAFRQFAMNILEAGLMMLQKTGKLNPIMIAWVQGENGEPAVEVTGMIDVPPKVIMPHYLRERGPFCHVFMSDAWEGHDPQVMPHEDPQRKELVLMAVKHPKLRLIVKVGYDREGPEIMIGKREVTDLLADSKTTYSSWMFDDLTDA